MRWMPDSRHLLIVDGNKLMQYEVETQAVTLTPLPSKLWPGYFVVDGGRRFLSVRERFVVLYDDSGNSIKTMEIPYRIEPDRIQYVAVSDDGRYLAINDVPFVVFDLQNPKKPIFSNSGDFTSPVFGPDGRTLFFFGYYAGHLGLLHIPSGEMKQLGWLPGLSARFASMLPPVKRA
jgi:WD40 repeat protein